MHAAVVRPHPCAMGIMTMNLYNYYWSHDSDSLLGMTLSFLEHKYGPTCPLITEVFIDESTMCILTNATRVVSVLYAMVA